MLDFAKRAIRLKYESVYDFHVWRESLRVVDDLPLDPNLGGVFFLPYDAQEVIFLSLSYDGTNYARLTYRERDWIERFNANSITVPGNLPTYSRGENLAWPYLDPGQFTFVSSDPRIFTLYIAGLNQNNFPIDETYTMQAVVNPNNTTNPAIVTTKNSFSKVTMITKGQTTMPLGISTQFPAPPNQISIQLPASTSQLMFTQIVLTPPPLLQNPDGTPRPAFIRGQYKLKADPLDSDYATPRISHALDALIEFTLASVYKKLRQLSKADDSEKRATGHLQAAINVEKNQSENHQQVVPVVYETGDYIGAAIGVSTSFPWGG